MFRYSFDKKVERMGWLGIFFTYGMCNVMSIFIQRY